MNRTVRDRASAATDDEDEAPSREVELAHPLGRAERARAAFLISASELLNASLDLDTTFERVAELAVPHIADGCIVETLERDSLRQIAVIHEDSSKRELAREIRRRFPPDPSSELGVISVIRSGRSALFPELSAELLVQLARDDEHLALLRQLGVGSAMIVPMVGRERAHGAITFVNDEASRRFEADDLAMGEELARRAGLAIDNARLYQAERDARSAAERATERLARIQMVTRELAGALTSERIAEVVIDHGVRAIGALTGGLWTLERGGTDLVLLRAVGFPDAALERYAKIALDGPAPLADAVRRRVPVFLESREQYAERYAESESRARDLTAPAVQGIACLPLLGGGEVLGGLAFAFAADRQLEDQERRFLMLLADHCTLALERAALYDAERVARAETELLYALVDATTRAPSLDAVHDAALDALTAALEADRVAILFSGADGEMRFVASRGLSRRHIETVEARRSSPSDVRDPQTIVFEDTANDARLGGWRGLLEAEGIRAMLFAPLVDRGRMIGKLLAYFSEPRRFATDELRLSRTIASHVAEAIGRKRAEAEIVRLFDEAEAARVVAEQAAVSREHLLALVAHDLRNSLHAAEMRTSLLLRRLTTLGSPAELSDDVATIQRSTEGMSRLIGDLLDAAAIQAGRLSIELRHCELSRLFSDALDMARAMGEEREIEVHGEMTVGDVAISCDRERMLQVLANLVGNAVKFSPRRSSVQLDVRRVDHEIWFVVRDRGRGIAREQLERVFERYFKGEGARPGIGLGLYIAKGLVEAQGGRIWVDSTPGVGTNVFVALPI